MTRRWIFYPFLIALFPILSLYAQNVTETPASETVWPLGLMLAASGLVWSLLRLGLPLTTITWEVLTAPPTKGEPPPAVASAHKTGRLPDIYYIILDGYARTD